MEFIALAMLLFFVTAFGHGLWLLFAFLFRAISGRRNTKSRDIHVELEDLLARNLIDVETHRKVVLAIAQRTRPHRAEAGSSVAASKLQPEDSDVVSEGVSDASPFSPSVDEPIAAELVDPLPQPPTPQTPTPQTPLPQSHSPESIAHRAKQYAAARMSAEGQRRERDLSEAMSDHSQEQGLERPESSTVPSLVPRRTWTEWLAAFLEESNIRWGELVGGLLIVSCSTALVISFWSEISARPLLKFGVFNGVIAALFLLGIHAARKWNLPSTSQGVLLIAMLLVPLNFLAIAAFTKGTQPDATTIAGEMFSIAIFGGLGFVAAQLLTPRWPIGTLFGVVGLSAFQLLVRRWVGPDTSMGAVRAMAAITAAIYFASHLPTSIALRREESDPDQLSSLASECWKLMGTVSFAVMLCLAFLLVQSERPGDAIQNVSLFGGLLAGPGLLIASSLFGRARETRNGAIAVASSAVGIACTLLLAVSVVVAWPQPGFLLIASGVAFAACTWVSLESRVSFGHYVASCFLAIIVVLIGQVAIGSISLSVIDSAETVRALASHHNGKLMVVAFAIAAALSKLFRVIGRSDDSSVYARISGVFAVAAFSLAFCLGFGRVGDATGLIWIAGAFAIVSLVAAAMIRKGPLVWCGAAMLQIAAMQWFVFGFPLYNNWLDRLVMSVLLVVSLLSVVRMIFRSTGRALPEIATEWRSACYSGAVVGGLLLTCRLGWEINSSDPILFLWLSATCLILSVSERSRLLFDSFQLAMLVACVLSLHHWQVAHDHIGPRLIDWFGPNSYYWQTILLACFILASVGLRALLSWRESSIERDQPQPWLRISEISTGMVTTVLSVIAILLVAASSVWIVVPGIGQELLLVRDSTVGRVVPDMSSLYGLEILHSAKKALPWSAWLSVLVASVFSVKLSSTSKFVDRRSRIVCGSLLIFCPFLMFAGLFGSDIAVASAIRWTTAVYFVLGCVAITRIWPTPEGSSDETYFTFGTVLAFATLPLLAMVGYVALQAFGYASPTGSELSWLYLTGISTIVMSVMAVSMRTASGSTVSSWWNRCFGIAAGMSLIFLVAVAVSLIAKTLVRHPVIGPESHSVFRRIGLAGSYVTPMVFVAIGFIGTAYRLRSQGLAFAASMLCNVCVTAAVLFVRKGGLDECGWISLAEINAIVAATCVLVWTQWRSRWPQGEAIAESPSDMSNRDLVRIVFGIGCSFLGLVAVSIAAFVFIDVRPDLTDDFVPAIGLAATVLIGLAEISLRKRRFAGSIGFDSTGRVLLLTMCLVLFASIQNSNGFFAYELLLTGWTAIPILSLLADWRRSTHGQLRNNQIWQALCFGSIALGCLFSVRAIGIGQLSDWWTIGGLAAAAVTTAMMGIATGRLRFVYIAGFVTLVASNAWWLLESDARSAPDFVHVNLIAWALPSIWWSLALWRLPKLLPRRRQVQQYIRFVVVTACIATLCLSVVLFASGLSGNYAGGSPLHAWCSLTIVLFAVLAAMFGGCGLHVSPLVYVLGLSAVGTYLDTLQLPPRDLIWAGCLALSAFGLVANYLASRRGELAVFIARYVPEADEPAAGPRTASRSQFDLISLAAAVVATTVLFLGVVSQFTCDSQPIRMVAAQAILAQTFAIALLPVSRWSTARVFALLFAEFGLVAFGWSWISNVETRLLDRIVVAAVSTAIVAFVYAIGLVKLARKENSWTRSALKLVPWLAGTIVLLVGAVLIVEASAFVEGRAIVIYPASIAAVAGTLLVVAGGCVAFAIWPGRDPLGLQREQLGAYVYAAEFILAMLFAHIRITMPWLFSGFFQQMWPLIVMAIAFAGVGFAELTKRLGRTELSRPLERTGAFLPMLPAIGVWILPAEVDFSFVMLAACVLYAVLASMRRSFGFGILAVATGNAGLWHLLSQQGIALFDHPQIWLIPPALCVLVAASLNRKRLTEGQSVSIRYACASTIYVSSTADIFINGVADAPWLPIVLAGLSIAGIFLGIFMRIRAFLFLGIAFLMVSLLTVVWHAAVDLQQTWIWYVAGIITGVAILFVFALFEKKRQTVLGTLNQLKEWQA